MLTARQLSKNIGAVALLGASGLVSSQASAAATTSAPLSLVAPRWELSILGRIFPSVGFSEVNDVSAGDLALGAGTSLRVLYSPLAWASIGVGMAKVGWSTRYEGSGGSVNSVSNNDGDTFEASVLLRLEPYSAPGDHFVLYALGQASVALTGRVDGNGQRVVVVGEQLSTRPAEPIIAQGDLRSGYSIGGSVGSRYSLLENVGVFAELGLDWRKANFASDFPQSESDTISEQDSRNIFTSSAIPESSFHLIQLAVDFGVTIQF